MKRISLSVAAMCLSTFLAAPSVAETSGSVYSAVVGKYLWRGQNLSDTWAVQPGASVSRGPLTFDAWFSHQEYVEVDLVTADERTRRGLAETDLTLTFESALPWSEKALFHCGMIAYLLHTVDEPDNDSEEFFAGMSADVDFSPYLTLYYDGVLADGAYLEAGAEKAYSLNDRIGLSFGLSAGYNFGQYDYESSLTVLGFVAGIDIAIGPVTVTPAVLGQIPLDAQYDDYVFGSIFINHDFAIGGDAAGDGETSGD